MTLPVGLDGVARAARLGLVGVKRAAYRVGVNPDADTTRIVRAEQFLRLVDRRVSEGLERSLAELEVALEEPHLACAVEQLAHPPELHAEIARRFLG